MNPLVTLTTDFGLADPYVAAMKGVIKSRCRSAEIVDLSHEIPPGSLLEGALFLAGAIPYFPDGTLHLAVVDPGVGTERTPIVAQVGNQAVVCPDNGLLTLASQILPFRGAYAITNPKFMRQEVSATFHGRDVFAAAAGTLAAGAAFNDAGPQLERINLLRVPPLKREGEHHLEGQVIHVDRFGNLITNIHRSELDITKELIVRVGTLSFSKFSRTYGDVPVEEPLVLIGSSNYIEIAVNQGNARDMLGLDRGATVEIVS